MGFFSSYSHRYVWVHATGPGRVAVQSIFARVESVRAHRRFVRALQPQLVTARAPGPQDGAVTAGPPKPPDLTAARAEVMALVAGSPMSMRPPTAQAAAPLRPLPAALEAKLAARAGAGLVPLGTEYPHGRVWQRVVLPSGTLAAADAVGVAVGAGAGHYLLATVAGVIFVPLAAVAAFGARFALRDALRLTAADRRAVNDASRWHSRQVWTGPLSSGAERGLVIAAARAAERIAATGTWRSGRIDEQRLHLDLGHELDQIDDQAHRIATARAEHGATPPGGTPVIDAAWDGILSRVAALTAYGGQLDGQDRARAEALARRGDPVRDADLMAGSVRDEMAAEELAALTYYLSANRYGDGDLSG